MGGLLAATLALASVFAIWNSAIIATAVSMAAKLGAQIVATIGKLTGYKIAAWLAAGATGALYKSIVALIGVLTAGIGAVILGGVATGLASQFDVLDSNIRSTTDALKEFDRVAGRTSGAFNPYGGDAPVSGSRAAGGGGQNVAVIEPSGNPQEQSSDVKNANWTMGRRTEQGGI
jgi:hypothetical protein